MTRTASLFRPAIALLLFTAFTDCRPRPRPQPSPTFATCESLDTLTLGLKVPVTTPPGSFQPPKMDIGVLPFTWSNGTATSGGVATIQSGGLAGGSGNEINVNNVTLWLSAGNGQVLKDLKFSFGEYGGNLNISINNTFKNFQNFKDIHNTTIAGVAVTVLSGGGGNDKGQIQFVGTMNDLPTGLGHLAVGGQELFVDDICYTKQ